MNNLAITVVTLALLHAVHGGPLVEKRSKREIYPEIEPEKVAEDVQQQQQQPQVCVVGDLVYGADELVPADQPCLRCKCQPPGVHCEATRCEKKPGCRAIHKPNTCCPDYQCECDFEGKTYANGERLEQKPGTECKVCYCRGGEVQCAEVSCYMRDDCEGRKVPGQCCLKYDHCPPRDPILDRPAYPTELTNITFTTRETTTTSENEINVTENVSDKDLEVKEAPKITIHEIIPEIKEIPITNSPKREIKDSVVQGQLLVEEAIKGEGGTTSTSSRPTEDHNELDVPDTESDSSEIAEIYQQPPPVLRIGDKLLFLKKGELVPEKDASTPATVITIIGAEGLQRGFEESIENHEAVVPKSEVESKTSESEDEIQSLAESSPVLALVQRPTTPKPVDTTEVVDDLAFSNCSLIEIAVELPAAEPNLNDTLVDVVTETANVSVSTAKPTTEKEDIQEVNPGYPPIPDIMSRPDEAGEHLDLEPSAKREVEIEAKILPDVLVSRSNKTVPQNVSNGLWLKNTLVNANATLPDSILLETADSDAEEVEGTSTRMPERERFETTAALDDFTRNNIKASLDDEDVEPTKSSLESFEGTTKDDSGERVTLPSLLVEATNEDASVEGTRESTEFNMSDLVEYIPGVHPENRTEMEDRSVEALSTTENSDVELIDADLLVKNLTHEDDAMDHPAKIVGKRENDESDQIFEELNREIGLASGTIKEEKSKDEEEKEAETIFKELLEESESKTTPKPLDLQPRDRESAVLQRVSDAIAKFQLRDTKQSLDSSILGILRDFFSSQYRAYSRK